MDKSEGVVGAAKDKHNHCVQNEWKHVAHTLTTSEQWRLCGDLDIGTRKYSKTEPMCAEAYGGEI